MAQQQTNHKQRSADVIATTLSSDQTLSSTTGAVNLTSTSFSSGTRLTRSGSNVVIGDGVSIVRVSYSLMSGNSTSANYLYAGITKSGARMSEAIDGITGGHFASVSETKLLQVAPGDTIGLVADCGGGSLVIPVSRKQSMAVEVIA